MSVQDISKKLVAFCQAGQNLEAIDALYSDDIVSVEAGAPPAGDATTVGKAAVLGKSKWWRENHEIHSAKVEGPFPNGQNFAAIFEYDITFKPTGQRFNMREVAVYETAGDKIVRESFYYAMG